MEDSFRPITEVVAAHRRRAWSALIFAIASIGWFASVQDSVAAESPASERIVRPLDTQWRFHRGDLPRAEEPDFDDQAWRQLDVPHDWSIEGKFDPENATGPGGGFLPSGVGWYRKEFTLRNGSPPRVIVEFDGVMANSEVWINGQRVGERPYGYVSFQCDLTDHVHFGEDTPNVLAVRVDNSPQPASRWYTGAGVYRHVRLVQTNPLHVAPAGVFVTTPEVSPEQATVHVQTEIENAADAAQTFQLVTQVLDPNGKVITTAESSHELPAKARQDFNAQLVLTQPRLWSLQKPLLYRAVTRIMQSDRTVDGVDTAFGIRQVEFKSDSGFWLNGENLKLKGVCLHHDGGALGAAVPLAVWERRLKTLQSLGVNAVRTSHNPPAPEFLALCDRLGILVMLELFDCWTKGKNSFDYHLHFNKWAAIDARDTIRRDRNHPSIILYSVGNEIRDTRDANLAKRILAELVDVCHRTDATRPVTQGLFRPNTSHDYDNGLADLLDVIGTNYRDQELLAARRKMPTRKIVGTEQRHDRETWLACRDHAEHAGQFLWCGVDYLGESPGWPTTTFNAGLLDRTGHPYPRALERQSWWSDEPMAAIFRRIAPDDPMPVDPGYETVEWKRRQSLMPDWTPHDPDPHRERVEVFSNCDEVELTLNGISLGAKPLPPDARPFRWDVEFEPGVLTATGRNRGEVVATAELRTAGKPARVVLRTDVTQLGSSWDDIAYVEAEIVDENGTRVPRATNLVEFRISGPAEIIAVDNGSITSHEPFTATQRHAHDGRCIAILRATGEMGPIQITAESDGLAAGKLKIEK
jgi:beta-galactosidase